VGIRYTGRPKLLFRELQMILISHRGNIDGPNKVRENSPYYIMEALTMGYDVEIDLWCRHGALYLGHDTYQYQIDLDWLEEKAKHLWVHCKNIEALEMANWFAQRKDLHYFWHQEDTVTLTSKGYIWAYPGKQPIENSIAVMPELNKDNIGKCIGVCSDFVATYK